MHLSIVSPVYKAEDIVSELTHEIINAVSPISSDFEIILVEDGSPDASWEAIMQEALLNKCIRGIKLSRNFGQHVAITAGLSSAKGDFIVVMDCDLQDNPCEIPRLYSKALQGYDSVVALRNERQDSPLKKISSQIFYRCFSFLSGINISHRVSNFGIYSSKVVKAVLQMGDDERYFPAMVQWVGFKMTYLHVNHSRRLIGQSSYNYIKLLKLAANNIISFSNKPLKITALLGLALSGLSFITAIIYLYFALSGVLVVSGFASIIISIYLIGGIIIFALGLVGVYLSKTFSKVKSRPLYYIDKTTETL